MIAERRGATYFTRRDFLACLPGLILLASIPSSLAFLSGCASVGLPVVRTFPEGKIIRIPIASTPALSQPGGAITLSLPKRKELVVVHLQQNEFIALSPICTHRGCTVRKVREGFECPCHGSRYDRHGQVVNGPATRPLTSYPVEFQGAELLIQYQGSDER